MNMIEAAHVFYEYVQKDENDNIEEVNEALSDLSLTIEKGSFVCVLGHNGSGKSTFAKLLNGLQLPKEGTILISGMDTRDDASLLNIRRSCGMVFQTPNVLPASIGQNLLLPLQLAAGLDMDEARSRARRSLEDVGLWPEVHDRLGDPAGSLSGGQQQRLCLARTLALEPQILLLDEPTASLDPASTRRIEDLLLQLSERYAIILVSHGIAQARRLATRLLLFEDGHARGPFPPEELARIFPHEDAAGQA